MMSTSDQTSWKTKYGKRRVRFEMPTLDEAIFAAQGLSDDLDEQADIAASLMGLPFDEVRAALTKLPPPRKEPAPTLTFTGPASAPRVVVVERKPSRRIVGAPPLVPGSATLRRTASR
jgi:hypothetical protein